MSQSDEEPGRYVKILRESVERNVEVIRTVPTAITVAIKLLENKDWASLRSDWKTWKFTLLSALSTQEFSEAAKRAVLIMRGGKLIQELAMRSSPDANEERVGEPDEHVFENLIKRIENRIKSTASETYDLTRFNGAMQQEDESIEAFERRLQDLAELCNLHESATEVMVRVRLLSGAKLGRRLTELSLPNPNMTVREITNMGTRLEESERSLIQAQKVTEDQALGPIQPGDVSLNAITKSRGVGGGSNDRSWARSSRSQYFNHDVRHNARDNDHQYRHTDTWQNKRNGSDFKPYLTNDQRDHPGRSGTFQHQRSNPWNMSNVYRRPNTECRGCGRNCAARSLCSARYSICNSCGKSGHLARVCLSRPSQNENSRSNTEGKSNVDMPNEINNLCNQQNKPKVDSDDD